MNAYLAIFDDPVYWLLQASWQAAVLVALVLSVQWLFRKQLPAHFRVGSAVVAVEAEADAGSKPHHPVDVFNSNGASPEAPFFLVRRAWRAAPAGQPTGSGAGAWPFRCRSRKRRMAS